MTVSTYDRLSGWPIRDIGLKPTPTLALERDGRFKTLADLEVASDEDLIAIKGLGRFALDHVRRQVHNVRASTSTLREDLIAWLATHETLAHALMKGEAVIVPRSEA